MSSKAELARIAQTRLTPIEEVAAELAQVIRENTEGQPAGRTPREQLLAGRAQELGSNLLHLLDEAAQSDNT